MYVHVYPGHKQQCTVCKISTYMYNVHAHTDTMYMYVHVYTYTCTCTYIYMHNYTTNTIKYIKSKKVWIHPVLIFIAVSVLLWPNKRFAVCSVGQWE